MTKSLLLNCYLNSAKINGLFEVLGQFGQCIVVPYGKIGLNYKINEDIDSIVISGSEARIVDASRKVEFENILSLIRTCTLPLLGICYGHQLLCSAFSASTSTLHNPVIDRFEDIRIVQTDDLFYSFKKEQTIPLSEYHNDYVLKEGLDNAGFTLLADSISCEVEAVKHSTKPFYGVQFHPERITIKNETHPEGNNIIQNFFKKQVKR
jgi:GMP synthase-like glutamine amidotransferase